MSDMTHLAARLAAACDTHRITITHSAPDELALSLPAESLAETARLLWQEFGATFVDLFGLESHIRRGCVQLHLLFSLDREHAWLRLLVELEGAAPAFPSLVQDLPAVDWYEREVCEELNLQPQGHPLPQRLRLPPDWPEQVYPQRAGFSWSQKVASVEPRHFLLETAPAGVVDYPLGPVRSGVVESGHYTLRTVGEELIDIRVQLFYKHRGVEKRAEGLAPELLPLLAERISGTSAFAHSLALCQALERVASIEAPPRARFLRTLLAEIERLYNHLGYQADLCQATGLVVAQAQFDILKEQVLRLNAAISGHRYLFGMNVPGGLSRDMGAEELRAVRDLLESCTRSLEELRRLLFASSSHMDRLEETGILLREEARAYGAVGPIGRASGIDRDLRRDHPYAAYADVEFEVPVLEKGDALARARLRLEEALQALQIGEQVLARLPGGAVRATMKPLPPGGSALGWAESARGESLHWLLVGEDGRLQRYRVRPASFANWQVFSIAIPGHNILTDFPVIEQSFGLSFAGADC